MISREEAKRGFNVTRDGKHIVDIIYDSIGSCSECIHQDNGTNDCYRMWSISCSDIPFDNWFCADFERKVNENTTKH